jgi:hypothetical protein
MNPYQRAYRGKFLIRKQDILILALCLLAIIALCFLWVKVSYAEEYTDTEIVNAIYKIEGGAKATFAYGIRSVHYSTVAEARRICFNTVRNNRKRYAQYGYREYPDFLSFLQSRYCPTKGKLSRAEKKLNGYWLNNLKNQLRKG